MLAVATHMLLQPYYYWLYLNKIEDKMLAWRLSVFLLNLFAWFHFCWFVHIQDIILSIMEAFTNLKDQILDNVFFHYPPFYEQVLYLGLFGKWYQISRSE